MLTETIKIRLMHLVASIAQSVEQGIENPRVGGSIPPRGTIFSEMVLSTQRFQGLCAGLAQLVEQLTCNQ